MMRISDIADIVEAWAPRWTAWEKDNVGMQVGDRSRPVRRVGVALEITPGVVQEAVRGRWGLIVSHHPLLFRPLRTLTSEHPIGGVALSLAKHRIAAYAAHTNLDFASEGVSMTLARTLGLRNVRFLTPLPGLMHKLVVFVPVGHEEPVLEALAVAGAGIIGEYSHCSFRSSGLGTFKSSDRAKPMLGRPGQIESTDESRIEALVPCSKSRDAIERVRAVHPYDEMAYDLYPVETPDVNHGMGAVGELPRAVPLSAFVREIKRRLKTQGIRFAGDTRMKVRTVAVCGGAGIELMPDAIRADVDAFVTSDIKYHAFHGIPPGFALIDAGHGETEYVILKPLADRLRAGARERGQRLEVVIARTRTNPVQTS